MKKTLFACAAAAAAQDIEDVVAYLMTLTDY
jgi:hypothetical protein